MRKIRLLAGTCLTCAIAALSAWADRRTVGDIVVTVTRHGPGTLHVTKVPKGRALAKSYAVPALPAETDGGVRYACDAEGALTFYGDDGQVLLREKGAAVFARRRHVKMEHETAAQTFLLPGDEPLFGLGDLQDGKLNVRGTTALLQPDNQGDGIAYVASPRGWSLFWDNASPVRFADDPAAGTMSFESQVAGGVDYWFFYGRTADGCVGEMRKLTGDVPMLPIWTYGYWQSKERYASQDEMTNVLCRYRSERIPIDGIVQDWRYWGDNRHWNAMEYLDPKFPDPKRMLDDIHANHAKMIITVWPSFGPETDVYRAMSAHGWLLPPFTIGPGSALEDGAAAAEFPSGLRLYDAYAPGARDLYWQSLAKLRAVGVDGWWMDATDGEMHRWSKSETEEHDKEIFDGPTAAGPFRAVRAAYSLVTTEAVYSRSRSDPATRDRRVFILTRGASAGQQRTGSAVWSGDVASTWPTLRNQVVAGLNYSLTGNPNYNCDIGGFIACLYWLRDRAGGEVNPAWRELYVRWMQFGCFLPMMRSHGTQIAREIYLYGARGEPFRDALEDAIRLRYRLLPYVYSTAARCCSSERYTMMRALMMDFPADAAAVARADEYMFGGSLLVAPVLEPGGFVREVYLPKGTDWWDFFTRERHAGGASVQKRVTVETIPLYVRAGSIVPIGPDVQYVAEKPWDDLELRIYPGADGTFTLYEDDGETYACERGERTLVRFAWNDRTRTLSIAAREGAYPGMLKTRRFRAVLPDGTVRAAAYDGRATEIVFRDYAHDAAFRAEFAAKAKLAPDAFGPSLRATAALWRHKSGTLGRAALAKEAESVADGVLQAYADWRRTPLKERRLVSTAWLGLELASLIDCRKAVGKPADPALAKAYAEVRRETIFSFWNNKVGWFVDPAEADSPTAVRTPAAYWVLWARMAPPERVARMCEYALGAAHVGEMVDLGDADRAAANFALVAGLRACGRERESEALAVRWYNDFADVWDRSGRPTVTTPHAALLPCE